MDEDLLPVERDYNYTTKEGLGILDFVEMLKLQHPNRAKNVLMKDAERLITVISIIIYHGFIKRNEKYASPFLLYTPLTSTILRETCTRNYKKYLDFLLANNIIEVFTSMKGKESYWATERGGLKGFSKSYRLTKEWVNERNIPGVYKYINPNIKKSIERRKASFSKEHKHLESFMYGLKLDNDLINFSQKHNAQINSFRAEMYHPVVDDSGRFYNNLTSMPSISRHFIKYGDSSLSAIDCKNSQPLLLAIMIEKECKDTAFLNSSEFLNFKKITERGLFYEKVQKLHDNYCIENKLKETPYKRGDLKKDVFKFILFNWNIKQVQHVSLVKAFKAEYPNVYKFIAANSTHKDELSYKLRHVESKIWVKGVVSAIKKFDPSIPIFTLHDAIFTPTEYIFDVSRIVKDVFKKNGLNPSFKMDEFGKHTKNYKNDLKEYNDNMLKHINKLKVKLRNERAKKLTDEKSLKAIKNLEDEIAIDVKNYKKLKDDIKKGIY